MTSVHLDKAGAGGVLPPAEEIKTTKVPVHGHTWTSIRSGGDNANIQVTNEDIGKVKAFLAGKVKEGAGPIASNLEKNSDSVFLLSREGVTENRNNITLMLSYKSLIKGEKAVVEFMKTLGDNPAEKKQYLVILESMSREKDGTLDNYLRTELENMLNKEYCSNKSEAYQGNITPLLSRGGVPLSNEKCLSELENILDSLKHLEYGLSRGGETAEIQTEYDHFKSQLADCLDYLIEARSHKIFTGDDKQFEKVFARGLSFLGKDMPFKEMTSKYSQEALTGAQTQYMKPKGVEEDLKTMDQMPLLMKIVNAGGSQVGRKELEKYKTLNDAYLRMQSMDQLPTVSPAGKAEAAAVEEPPSPKITKAPAFLTPPTGRKGNERLQIKSMLSKPEGERDISYIANNLQKAFPNIEKKLGGWQWLMTLYTQGKELGQKGNVEKARQEFLNDKEISDFLDAFKACKEQIADQAFVSKVENWAAQRESVINPPPPPPI